MDSLEIAFGHAPNVPLSDHLEHYRRVGYANIDQGRWYYMTYDGRNDFIVEIEEKNNDHILGKTVAIKLRVPEPGFPIGWTIPEEYTFLISPAMMEFDGYEFYEYVDDQNVEMTGGGLAEDIATRFRNPVYTLPAGTDVLRTSMGVLETEGIPNLPVNLRRPRKARRTRKTRKTKRKSGTRRRR
jgi:hypothetical protein